MMHRTSYTLAIEPRGVVYRKLCEFAERGALDVLFVVRDRPALAPGALALIAKLERSVIVKRRGSEWPGTKLIGDTAVTYLLRPDASAWAVIRESAGCLFDWQQPDLPEDLCLLRQDGSTFLGTVAHEHDAFVELEDREREALLRELPEILLPDPPP